MDVAQDIVGTAVGQSADHVARRVSEHYERRGRELWGLARRLGASDEEAADVVQKAHLRLWRELSTGTYVEDVDAQPRDGRPGGDRAATRPVLLSRPRLTAAEA
jgi:hypothetical protein